MTAEEMLNKMKCYSDSCKYRHLEKLEILENAIETRTYPFDINRQFKIKIIDFETSKIIPDQMKIMKDTFEHLIYKE